MSATLTKPVIIDVSAFREPVTEFGKMLEALKMVSDMEQHSHAYSLQTWLANSDDEQLMILDAGQLKPLREQAEMALHAARLALEPLILRSLTAGDLESYRQQKDDHNRAVGRLHTACLQAGGVFGEAQDNSFDWSRAELERQMLFDSGNQIQVWALERLNLAHLLENEDGDGAFSQQVAKSRTRLK